VVTKLGWLKSTDKVYSTGLVVAGRKVPGLEYDSPKESRGDKLVDSPSNPPKEEPPGRDPKTKQ
jgi:hypothetical protein